MTKGKKNFILENNIDINYFNKNLYTKDKKKLNKIINNTFSNLNNIKNTFHILSKKFDLDFDKSKFKRFIKYNSVVLIGMGGSVLGAHAIYSFLKQNISKQFFFIDNIDR